MPVSLHFQGEIPYVATPEAATELTMTEVYTRGLLHILGVKEAAAFAFQEPVPACQWDLPHDVNALPYFRATQHDNVWDVDAYISPPRKGSSLVMTAARYTLDTTINLQKLGRDVYLYPDYRGNVPPLGRPNSKMLTPKTTLRSLNDALEILIRSRQKLQPYWQIDRPGPTA